MFNHPFALGPTYELNNLFEANSAKQVCWIALMSDIVCPLYLMDQLSPNSASNSLALNYTAI